MVASSVATEFKLRPTTSVQQCQFAPVSWQRIEQLEREGVCGPRALIAQESGHRSEMGGPAHVGEMGGDSGGRRGVRRDVSWWGHRMLQSATDRKTRLRRRIAVRIGHAHTRYRLLLCISGYVGTQHRSVIYSIVTTTERTTSGSSVTRARSILTLLVLSKQHRQIITVGRYHQAPCCITQSKTFARTVAVLLLLLLLVIVRLYLYNISGTLRCLFTQRRTSERGATPLPPREHQ